MQTEPTLWGNKDHSSMHLTDEEKAQTRKQMVYQTALTDLECCIKQLIDESELRKDADSVRWVLNKIQQDWIFVDDDLSAIAEALNNKMLDD